jgi:alkylated DNA repair protein (DNA oxidative demethylase)
MKAVQTRMPPLTRGPRLYRGYLSGGQQAQLLAALREVFAAAPLFTPRMPKSGRPFTVRMSNCGPPDWVSDEHGYRYQPLHPDTRRPWPPMPPAMLAIWSELARYPAPPEACLINYYRPSAKMGLHQDRDETDFDAPVVSISLGDSCLFRVGGLKRREPTQPSVWTRVMRSSSAARPASLSTASIVSMPGTSRLLPEGGRINLTLRRVTRGACAGSCRPPAAEAPHDEQ